MIGCDADYFDGRHARAHPVRLRIDGGRLLIEGDGIERVVAFDAIVWSERQRHGSRVAGLPDGATLHARDPAAWDALLRAAGRRDSWVVRAQQNWRAVLAAGAILLAVLVAGWLWGVPLAARVVVAVLPADLDRVIGEQVAASLDGSWLEPTQLPADRRERIALALEAAVAAAWPDSPPPAYQLRFARSRIGPNALALPGGQIVVTDELIRLADRAGQDATPMLVGVLGHELGHVVHRHGLRAVVQAGLVAGVAAVALGDFSGLLAGAPAVLAQQGYSRDFEREADRESVRILRAGGYSPALMARFFELIAEARRDPQQAGMMARIAVALASHPADAERIRFFRAAAGAVQ